MAEVKANHRLTSTVKLARWLRRDPILRALMKPALWKKVDGLATRIEAVTKDLAEIEEMGEGNEEDVFQKTHAMLGRMLKGVRYVYADSPTVLTDLEPLQVGENPSTDSSRLSFLFEQVPTKKPKWVWVEDFTAEMVRDQLKAHAKAHAAVMKVADGQEKAADLRKLRPEAEALWTKDKVEQWVEVNADSHEDAVAMGLERRHRNRKPKADGEAAAKKGKSKKTKEKTDAPEDAKVPETELEE